MCSSSSLSVTFSLCFCLLNYLANAKSVKSLGRIKLFFLLNSASHGSLAVPPVLGSDKTEAGGRNFNYENQSKKKKILLIAGTSGLNHS